MSTTGGTQPGRENAAQVSSFQRAPDRVARPSRQLGGRGRGTCAACGRSVPVAALVVFRGGRYCHRCIGDQLRKYRDERPIHSSWGGARAVSNALAVRRPYGGELRDKPGPEWPAW